MVRRPQSPFPSTAETTLSTLVRTLGIWRGLPAADRSLLLEATLLLPLVRLALVALPFGVFARLLGDEGRALGMGREEDAPVARRVAWAVRRVARRVPLRCACFERSVATRFMLRRRGVDSILHLGVHRGRSGVRAHAWLCSGGDVVVGGPGHHNCKVVGTFH
jgi:hypothetical protein